MKKKLRRLLSLVFICSMFVPKTVWANYFDHHKDWKEYCIQAKDVVTTEVELKDWIKAGILNEKIVEKSEIITRRFQTSDVNEPWSTYDGTYEIDDTEVIKVGVKEGCEIPVIIYLDMQEPSRNYIEIVIKIQEENIVGQEKYTNHTKNAEKASPMQEGKKADKQVKEMNQNIIHTAMLFMAGGVVAALCFAKSIYSDFRFLCRYKKKLEERGEKWRWRY